MPGKGAPVVLIIPGSGPTDRDGNNPLGVTAAPYRLLAEALAAKGVSSVRIDKRGMFGSKAAVADRNKVTIGDYAADAHNWVADDPQADRREMRLGARPQRRRADRARRGAATRGICGVILVSGAGRKLERRDPRAASRQPRERAGARLGDGGARLARARRACRRDRHAPGAASSCSRRRCRTFSSTCSARIRRSSRRRSRCRC